MSGDPLEVFSTLAPDLGLSGLVAAGLWAILTGRLVPRRTVEDYRETIARLTKTNDELQKQVVEVLMPLATTTHSTMSAVQRAAGLTEPSPPPVMPVAGAPEAGP